MLLSIEEAATRLGKTPRQVRYMIKTESLSAEKLAGRWVINSEDLPLSKGQEKAVQRKERQLRAAVEEGLGLNESDRQQRYSVRDLKAFQLALPLYQTAADRLGADHRGAGALRQVLEHLSRGCHRYDRGDKTESYRLARDSASLAVCELVLHGQETEDLVTEIEQELMAALAGLIRRLDRRAPK